MRYKIYFTNGSKPALAQHFRSVLAFVALEYNTHIGSLVVKQLGADLGVWMCEATSLGSNKAQALAIIEEAA